MSVRHLYSSDYKWHRYDNNRFLTPTTLLQDLAAQPSSMYIVSNNLYSTFKHGKTVLTFMLSNTTHYCQILKQLLASTELYVIASLKNVIVNLFAREYNNTPNDITEKKSIIPSKELVSQRLLYRNIFITPLKRAVSQ